MIEDDGQSGDWQRLAGGLADGRRDREVRDLFWCVLEARVRGVVLSGPANDPLECRLRPRFRGLLPDVHAAEDFTSDFLGFLLRKFDEGCYHTEDFRNLSASEGLGRIASVSLIRHRVITFSRRLFAGGVTGLPGDAPGVFSLDAGEDGGRAGSIPASVSAAGIDASSRTPEEMTCLAAIEGKAVLVLDLSQVSAGAVLATAGLQLHPRLDPAGVGRETVRSAVVAALASGRTIQGDVEPAHETAATNLEREIADALEERRTHPGMEPRTVDRWERRLYQFRARVLIQPLDGSETSRLFGLPSVNAGEQRISNYRKVLVKLLPGMAAMVGPEEHS